MSPAMFNRWHADVYKLSLFFVISLLTLRFVTDDNLIKCALLSTRDISICDLKVCLMLDEFIETYEPINLPLILYRFQSRPQCR